jgi:hypothetical protein
LEGKEADFILLEQMQSLLKQIFGEPGLKGSGVCNCEIRDYLQRSRC